MKYFLVALLLIFIASPVSADTHNPLYDDEPLTVTVVGSEHFVGTTASGHTFVQSRLVTDATIRIHKFVIANHFFYISNRGYIEASSDLMAISIYLSLT